MLVDGAVIAPAGNCDMGCSGNATYVHEFSICICAACPSPTDNQVTWQLDLRWLSPGTDEWKTLQVSEYMDSEQLCRGLHESVCRFRISSCRSRGEPKSYHEICKISELILLYFIFYSVWYTMLYVSIIFLHNPL